MLSINLLNFLLFTIAALGLLVLGSRALESRQGQFNSALAVGFVCLLLMSALLDYELTYIPGYFLLKKTSRAS